MTKSDDRAAGVRLFITTMITNRIGRHEVLLPINHKSTFSEKRRIARLRKRGNICMKRLTKEA